MRRTDWAEFTAADIAALDPERTLAVLPVAAIEQHGPHLPLGTDAMIAEGMLETVRQRLPEDLHVAILPVQAVGKSNEHIHAPGTLSLAAETALAAWTEIGLSVARAGLRRIVIVNSHGGNADLISILARELRVRAEMLAVRCHWGAFGLPEGLIDEREQGLGIHGGTVETALMLHFRPGLVDMGRARTFASTAATTPVPPVGPVAYGWIASDLNPAGTVGDATAATAEMGRRIAEHQAAGFLELLACTRDFDRPGVFGSG